MWTSSTEKPPPPRSDLRRRFTDASDRPQAVIERGTRIDGEVQSRHGLELRGAIEGSCIVEGLLRVRVGGRIKGDVRATDVVLEGEVEGDIEAAGKVELRAGCRLQGDVRAGWVAIAEGGFLRGSVETTQTDRPATFRERRVPDPPARED